MTTRNLTTTFNNLRGTSETINIMVSDTQNPMIDYIIYFSTIDELFNTIEKLEKEATIILNKLRISVFNTDALEDEYKNIIKRINNEIEQVRQLFSVKNDIYKKYFNTNNLGIVKNMYNQKLNKFEVIINNYQKIKSIHLQYLKITKENNNTEIDDIISKNNTIQKIECDTMEYNFELIDERNKEIEELVNSIKDLADMFKDLQTMIYEQSETIDKIEFTMSEVVTKTDKGVKNLQIAEKEQKKCTIQ